MFGLRLSQDDWLLLSLLFFILVMALTIYYVRKLRKAQFLDPVMIFLFFYCLFVLPLPIRAYITKEIVGDVTEHLPELLPYIPWALFLCALGVPFFVCGYYSDFAGRFARRLPLPRTARYPGRAFVMLAGLSLFLILQLARDFGGFSELVLWGYGVGGQMIGKGYLAIGFTWLFVASVFLLCRYIEDRKKSRLVLFWIVFAMIVAMLTIMGRRGDIAYMLLAITIFWHYAVRPLNIKVLTALALFFFVSLNLFGQLRGSEYGSLADFWTKTTANYSETSDSSNRWYYTLSTGEFVVPFETMPQMIRSVGTDVSPEFGWTFLRAPVFAVPSVLYPNRPVSLSNWYMDEFYGFDSNLYVGRQFFFLSEGYLNFGPIGIPLLMYFWGLFAGIIWRFRVRFEKNVGVILIYSLTVAFFFIAIAGDFSTLLVGLPAQYLAAALLGLWISCGFKSPFTFRNLRAKKLCLTS
ncbi:MAG TPA: hypothetical protein VNE63_04345 [Candidatus Acidoferrales bacterium]|nr:hypothetical protein [Candidatus Acidoferrales bacterium]